MSKEQMRLALKTLHDLEVVGDPPLMYWGHFIEHAQQARNSGSVCTSCCRKWEPLKFVAVHVIEGREKSPFFYYLCAECGPDKSAQKIALQRVQTLVETGTQL